MKRKVICHPVLTLDKNNPIVDCDSIIIGNDVFNLKSEHFDGLEVFTDERGEYVRVDGIKHNIYLIR